MFGAMAKTKRIAQKLTLREFCEKCGLDASNWSKVERGINPPPGEARVLERIATVLELSGTERNEFLDTAAITRREFPADLAQDVDLMKALPAFFRSARDHQLTDEELRAFGECIRKLHTRDAHA